VVVFGVFLPIVVAWFTAKAISRRLLLWWGTLIAVLVGWAFGVILPTIISAVLVENASSFSTDVFIRAVALALFVAAVSALCGGLKGRQAGLRERTFPSPEESRPLRNDALWK
jgi:ABC-type uncharacterized transport system permease subunit